MLAVPRHADLPGTPLLITIMVPEGRGVGSGFLIHPRVLLTAGHVTPEGATVVVAFVDGAAGAEVLPVERVVRSRRDGWWGEDWALLVLERACEAIPARAAPPTRAEPPEIGESVLLAGFPGRVPGEATGRLADHEAMLLRSRVIARPDWAGEDPAVLFVADTTSERRRTGMSGGPVFVDRGGTWQLCGLYVGDARQAFLGADVDRVLVIQPLPRDAIAEAIAGLRGPAP